MCIKIFPTTRYNNNNVIHAFDNRTYDIVWQEELARTTMTCQLRRLDAAASATETHLTRIIRLSRFAWATPLLLHPAASRITTALIWGQSNQTRGDRNIARVFLWISRFLRFSFFLFEIRESLPATGREMREKLEGAPRDHTCVKPEWNSLFKAAENDDWVID